MPTLVAALTLSALLKMAHVDLPRWHLAFWFGLLVALALFGACLLYTSPSPRD